MTANIWRGALAVHVDAPGVWQYKFELRFADGKVNILDAMLHGNVASSELKESYLSAAGPCELQVRGLSGEREIKSNVLGLMLAESIKAGTEFAPPSEFEQLEQIDQHQGTGCCSRWAGTG